MDSKAQSILKVLVSSLLFGTAGFWLVPSQLKGAVAGSIAGAAVATGYVSQDRRLKHLAAKQKDLLESIQSLQAPLYGQVSAIQDKETLRRLHELETFSKEYSTKVSELEDSVHPQSGRAKLTQNEINRIRKKLKELEDRLKTGDPSQTDSEPSVFEQFEARLKKLEARSKVILSDAKKENHEANKPQEAVDELESEDISIGEASQQVIEWFIKRNIEVESYYEPDPTVDEMLDGLSIYLGDNYTVLNKFHKRLRNTVGRRLNFNLGNYDSRERRIHNQFLKKLKTSSYLSRGRLIKKTDAPDLIIADLHNRADIQGFLDGGWFERFVYYKIIELFDSKGVDYQYLRNPKITYPDEQSTSTELDLFFLMNGKPLLIECKSGANYDEGIGKFSNHRKRLAIDASYAVFVVLDIDDSEAYIRARKWDIIVANQIQLLEKIKQIAAVETADVNPEKFSREDQDELNYDDIDSDEKQGTLLLTNDYSSLEDFFKKNNLNRAPEHRSKVFDELVELMNENTKETTFNELSKTIRDQLKETHGLGRNKVVEILNCLRYSNLFRNSKNKPERNTSQPIASIESKHNSMLERKCMEFYAEKILQLYDPDFFDEVDNVQEFERLTHGKVPPLYRIQHLKDR
ncbi:MAG: hypothetical protein AAGG51_12760 [Cyanobacteria bacterium P01_G01_bin.54]